MKTFFALAVLLTVNCNCALAEFAQIIDSDGHTNMRQEPSVKSSIIGKVRHGAWVYTPEGDSLDSPSKDGWYYSSYRYPNGQQLEGWIHQSRLRLVSSYPKIPVTTRADGFSCLKNGTGLMVSMGNFPYLAHKKEFTGRNDKAGLTKYRGKRVWGTDGTIPQTHYRSIVFTRNGKKRAADKVLFEHLFNPYFDTISEHRHRCFYNAADDTFFLTALNSDGAGVYEALFIFSHGRLKTVHPYLHPEV